MAKYYKWNFDKIAIYPFGGCTKFDEKINRSMKEELFILFNGPMFQMILFAFVFILFNEGFISFRGYTIFKHYHYTLLLFNLLPIYPLDGGKILNIVINYLFPFKKGNKLVVVISSFILIVMLLLYKNLNFTLMGILLFTELIIYFKRQDFLYNRMLLERYIFPFNFSKFKIIKSKNSMYKDRRHIVLYNGKYITEKDYLNKRFR